MSAQNACLNDAQFQALLAGTASEVERRQSEEHLTVCIRCRHQLEASAGNEAPWRSRKPSSPALPNSARLQQAIARLKAESGAAPDDSGTVGTLAVGALRSLHDYEILEELGRGGMGVVYRARQSSLRREVALKVMLAGQLASPADVRRFRVEAEAAARLDHPHIVPIFEIGEHEGHHFFSMKFVEGRSLEQDSAKYRVPDPTSSRILTSSERDGRNRKLAHLMANIARAVHYAHQRGVLHRDLKPANILIDGAGTPHVTDFGLAKLFEHDTRLTHSAAILGTPSYIAPEVAAGRAREATTSADVYSLGAILYELLAGRPPFQADSTAQTLRLVLDSEPPSPVFHNRFVPADLATIALKCLEKEPVRRYGSAEQLADDLQRFCQGDPIAARPITRAERTWRWCRRQPVLAGLTATLVIVFVLGFAGVVWKWRGEIAHRRIAQQQRERALDAVRELEIERAESLFQAGDSSRGLAHLARLLRQEPSNFVVAERLMSALSLRSFCLPIAPLRHSRSLDSLTGERKQALANRFAFRHPGSLVTIRFSPDGARLVTASRDGTARVWNANNAEPIGKPLKHDAEVLSAQFSGDGRRILTASVDGTAKIWRADTGQLTLPPLQHKDVVQFATFSGDSRKIITASRDKTVVVWNAETGQPIGNPIVHPAAVYFACLTPDDRFVLSAAEDSFARLWNAESRTVVAEADHFYFATSPTPFPQHNPFLGQVATLRWHGAVLRNIDLKLKSAAVLLHDDYCTGVTFSPDGRRVASVSNDTTARLWDAVTGEAILAPLRHADHVSLVQFADDGQKILTASQDKTARLWEVRTGQALTEPIRQEQAILTATISPTGTRAATISETDVAWLWDVRLGQPLVILRWLSEIPEYSRFSPDGRRLVVVDESAHARIWDARSGALQSERMFHAIDATILDARFSPDGRRLCTSSENRTLQMWDGLTGEPLGPAWPQPRSANRLRFSPDGKQIVTGSNDGIARLLDAGSGNTIFEMRHSGRILSVEFSSDGARLVTASADGTARVWNTATGEAVGPPLQHDSEVFHGEFDRAAQRVATASKDKTVRIWSVSTGRLLTPPLAHADALQRESSVVFSPDGSRIVSVAGNAAQVWDAATGRAITMPLRHDGRVRQALFTKDGRKLLTSSEDGTARFWDPVTGHAISEPLRHGGRVTNAEFSPDGSSLVTCSADKAVRVWEITSPPHPVPAWFTDLAEAVAGQHINEHDVSDVVTVTALYQLRQKLAGNNGSNFYERWARWFFADSATRTVSLSAEMTVPNYVQRRIDDNTRESLQEATVLSATNALAYARLAEELVSPRQSGPHKGRPLPADADWFSRYATNLAPNHRDILQIRELVLQKLRASAKDSKP